MSFTEVQKTSSLSEISDLKYKYRELSKEYDEQKADFIYHVSCEDFELLSAQDFLKLKEAYTAKKKAYWKLFTAENPKDTATVKAYEFLNSLSFDEKIAFLQKNDLTTISLIAELERNPNFIEEVTA